MAFKTLFLGFIFSAGITHAAPLIVTDNEMDTHKFQIDLNIDGVTKRFQLDTGSNTTHVSSDEFTSQYPSEGQKQTRGASGIPFVCDKIRPKRISLEGSNFDDAQIQRCDYGKQEFNNLGNDLLDAKVLELNIDRRELFVGDTPQNEWSPKPFTKLAKGHFTLPIQIAGVDHQGLFDTGAEITTVDSKFVAENPTLFKFHSKVTGSDVAAKSLDLTLYEVASIEIGTLSSGPIYVAAFDFGQELREYFGLNTPIIIGNNIIIKANWLLDLKASQWDVRPLPSKK